MISEGETTFSARTVLFGRPVVTPRICTVTGMLGSLAVNCTPTAETTRLRSKLKVWASGSIRTGHQRQRQTTRITGMRMMRVSTMRRIRVMMSGSLIWMAVLAE